MLSPAREHSLGSAMSFDSRDGGAEFGAPALQGYTFTLNEPVGDGLRGSTSVQALGSRAMACFPEFVVNAAGSPGVDGVHGDHGIPGRKGADGAHGKDGYGPGRPGKPGKPGKDGRPGTAGKKGKKGMNGTSGGRALNVVLSLSGEGLESVTVNGHLERLVKADDAKHEGTDAALPDETRQAANETVLRKEPLTIVHRLNTYPNQRPLPELDDLDNLNRESLVLITPDGLHGAALNFFTRRGVVLVRAHGGRGGNGGNGGNGGYGKDGGRGGHGGKGGDGKKGMKPGWDGENGGRGGDGGAGMAGGAGADGCPAGKGGNAGSGGRVTIETKTAKLLMLVETDARTGLNGKAGKPGEGGEGGLAGKGGLGGRGGLGGPPWNTLYLKKQHKYKHYRCFPGIAGAAGNYGGMIGPKQALKGMPGSVAPDGKEGKDGQVAWILRSADGEIIEKAKERFNCAVCQFRVRAGSGNGIISPGSTITIDKVIVWNNGGMTLPEGTRLSFTGSGVLTTSSKNMRRVETLPAIRKNKRYKCTSTFSMAVDKLDGPAGGSPFQALVSVMPSIELCGRNFSVTDQVLEVPVQFPIQILGDVQFPHTVHQGSTVTVQFSCRNISSRSYGDGKRSLGKVEARVLFFLELEVGQRVERKWTKEVSQIGAGQEQQLQFDCRVDTNGQPYSILSVQVHLLLKGQSIEYRHLESRIIPVYRATTDVDAVIVTDTDFKPGVYNLWKSILALLGLKCVFWDVSWYQTYSAQDVPWIGKHRLVIFTLWLDDKLLAEWLTHVLPHHVRALGGPKGIDNAGAIFVGPTTKDIARELVDWSNGEKLQSVKVGGLFASCMGDNMTSDDGVKRAVLKASKLQKKIRAKASSSQEDYTCHVSPVKRLGVQSIPLLLFRETLPALFRTRAISVQMIEDPGGVELLASSPLLSTQDATGDIYSGISTAIGGLITAEQSNIAPSFRRQTSVRPARSIALDGKYITLGLTLAGLVVALPSQFRIDILFRLARYACTDLPVLSSSGIVLTEVIAISFYNDLKSDWLAQRDSFPHGRALVAEFDRAVTVQGFLNVVDVEAFVVAITGGLVLMIDELKGLSRRKGKAKSKIKHLLKRMQITLGTANSVYTPRAEKVRMDYISLQQTLPPWLFSYEDELQVIRVLDDHGIEAKK